MGVSAQYFPTRSGNGIHGLALMILECNCISKTYGSGSLMEQALAEVSVSFRRGECCLLLGPSGSGKTTLLSIIGCMLSPTSGELRIDSRRVEYESQAELSRLRREYIGFVFQHAQLLPFLTMEENLRVVGANAGLAKTRLTQRLDEVTERLGIQALRHKKPAEASGGQRQRVAIARSVLHQPPIILADEPTAALDWHNGQVVVKLLTEQARADNALLVTVTHDTRLIDCLLYTSDAADE